MASVWVARHLTLGVDVAVKFIDSTLLDNPDIRSRFAQEAMAAAQIRSRHVVSILDYGTGESGLPYIAMELLDGEDLGARMERVGQLPMQDVVRLVTQTCKGLAKAHAVGIIHRDIKPENLFIVDDDDEDDGFLVKILDFGIAKADLLGLNRTETGVLMGTPLYMSPEQAIGTKIDHRTDLYSLTTVAFHCLAGRPPFDRVNLAMLVLAITSENAPSIRSFRPEVSPEVERWFLTGMNKDRTRRFPTAREMAQSFSSATERRAAAFVEWSGANIVVADILAAQHDREAELAHTLPLARIDGPARGAALDIRPSDRTSSSGPIAPREELPPAIARFSHADDAGADGATTLVDAPRSAEGPTVQRVPATSSGSTADGAPLQPGPAHALLSDASPLHRGDGYRTEVQARVHKIVRRPGEAVPVILDGDPPQPATAGASSAKKGAALRMGLGVGFVFFIAAALTVIALLWVVPLLRGL